MGETHTQRDATRAVAAHVAERNAERVPKRITECISNHTLAERATKR